MRLTITLILIFIATPAFCGEKAGTSLRCDSLYTDGRTLWAATESGTTRKILSDPQGVYHPRFSPDGSRLVYSNNFATNSEDPPDLVIATVAGSQSRALHLRGLPTRAVIRLGWRGNDRIWLEGHMSPIASLYYEVDVETGSIDGPARRVAVSVSPDGHHITSIDTAPYTNPRLGAYILLLNEEAIYPPPGDHKLHGISIPVWAPDGSRFAFIDTVDHTGGDRLMVASADGKSIRRLGTDLLTTTVDWLPNGSLLIATDGRYSVVDVSTGGARSIDEREARRWLYVTMENKSFPIEDRHCFSGDQYPERNRNIEDGN